MTEHDRAQHLDLVEGVVILLEHGKALARRDVDRAFRRLDVAREDAQERRLARAVRADDAVAIARRELDAYILEQDALAKLQRQSACTNHKIRSSTFPILFSSLAALPHASCSPRKPAAEFPFTGAGCHGKAA